MPLISSDKFGPSVAAIAIHAVVAVYPFSLEWLLTEDTSRADD